MVFAPFSRCTRCYMNALPLAIFLLRNTAKKGSPCALWCWDRFGASKCLVAVYTVHSTYAPASQSMLGLLMPGTSIECESHVSCRTIRNCLHLNVRNGVHSVRIRSCDEWKQDWMVFIFVNLMMLMWWWWRWQHTNCFSPILQLRFSSLWDGHIKSIRFERSTHTHKALAVSVTWKRLGALLLMFL